MKHIFLILYLIIMASAQGQEHKKSNGSKQVQLINGNVIDLPYLRINKESFTAIEDVFFKHSVGGKSISQETAVMVKYDENFLEVSFECRNNPRIEQNFYLEDNSSMYNQEVFELFISPGEAAAETYMEIEINPNNALFLARIYNGFKSDQQFKFELIDTKSSGIEHFVEKDVQGDIWRGYLKIPRSLINDAGSEPTNIFRINFYRIISKTDQRHQDWKVDQDNAIFSCWSSTMSDKPQFHVPERFGFLILD